MEGPPSYFGEETYVEFINHIYNIIAIRLTEIGAPSEHRKNFLNRWFTYGIEPKASVHYTMICSGREPCEGDQLDVIETDFITSRIRENILYMEFSFLNTFIKKWKSIKTRRVTSMLIDLSYVSHFGLDNLASILKEEIGDFVMGDDYTLFLKKVNVDFLTKDYDFLHTEYDDASSFIKVRLKYDIINEEEYRPPIEGTGGIKYEEAKTRFEKTR